MKDGVKFEFDEDHIRVTLEPGYEVEPESSDALWGELKRLCDAHGTCRVLVEGRAPIVEPEASEVIAAGRRAAAVPKLWIAFHFADFTPNEKSELFEVIAATKGVRAKHFSNRDQALMWLRKNSPA